MPNNNELLKNRFMERHISLGKAIPIIVDAIKMLENINTEEEYTEAVQKFVSDLPDFEIKDGELEQVKEVFNEFLSNQLSKTEAIAYLNYIHDVTYFKATNMLLIQDIFKCYF